MMDFKIHVQHCICLYTLSVCVCVFIVSETLALKGSYRVDLESGVDVEVAPNYKEQLDGFQVLFILQRYILISKVT